MSKKTRMDDLLKNVANIKKYVTYNGNTYLRVTEDDIKYMLYKQNWPAGIMVNYTMCRMLAKHILQTAPQLLIAERNETNGKNY